MPQRFATRKRHYRMVALGMISVVVADVVATAASFILSVTPRLRSNHLGYTRVAAAVVMGLAIVVISSACSFATAFHPLPPRRIDGVLFDGPLMAASVGMVSLMMAGLALIAASRGRRIGHGRASPRDAAGIVSDGFVFFDRQDRLIFRDGAYRRICSEATDLLASGIRFEDIVRHAVITRGNFATRRSHGRRDIDGEPERGTTFWLYLSRAQSGDTPAQMLARARPMVRNRATIPLAADSRPLPRMGGRRSIGPGDRVLEAESPGIALRERHGEHRIDPRLSHAAMPNAMDDIALAKRAIRRLPRPEVLLTWEFQAFGSSDQRTCPPELPLRGKPYRIHDPARAVREALNGRGQRSPGDGRGQTAAADHNEQGRHALTTGETV